MIQKADLYIKTLCSASKPVGVLNVSAAELEKLCQAVHYVIACNKGKLLQPTDIYSKISNIVSDVLLRNHPSPPQLTEKALQDYDTLPSFININVMADTVWKFMPCVQGAAGSGDVDSIVWQA
eukprot:8342858-Ditylum_brightwellii.AAC.1